MATTDRAPRRPGIGALAIVSIAVGSAVVLAAAGAASVAVGAARAIITPPRRRPDDVRVHEVDLDAGTITLQANSETVVHGRYGFWFSANSGYARLGDVVSHDTTTVTRQIESVVFGELGAARSGRWSGWYFLTPEDLGRDFEDVELATPVGPQPAWIVRAPRAEDDDRDRWAVLVHGRAVTRSETLRAVDTFLDAGFHCLIVSYRNDEEGMPSPDHRYALGDREWTDVEAGMRFALDAGATDLVLMGYSMGGATVLQALDRSPFASVVRGVALDSPVIDWVDTIDHQIVTVRGLPAPVRSGVVAVLRSRLLSRATGLAEPIDIARLDWVGRAAELAVPVLIQHSDADDFVPSRASRALAEARPDLVTYEAFDTAKHTRLWNYDPERWSRALADWLGRLDQRA